MESLPTPLDQTFAQATLPTQTTFDPGHPAVISLVIIAKKVQQAVQSQDPQLDLNRMAGQPGLAAGGCQSRPGRPRASNQGETTPWS